MSCRCLGKSRSSWRLRNTGLPPIDSTFFFTVFINSNFSNTKFIFGNYDEQNMWRNNTCFLFIWTQLKETMKSKLCEIHHVICLPWPVNPTPSWGTQFSLRPPFSPIPYCGYHPFTATCSNDQDAWTL